MNKTVKTIATTALKRFVEILLVNVFISVVITLLNTVGLLNQQVQIFHALLAGTALTLVVNIVFMRRCYYDLTNRLIYYTSNYIAYFLFLIVNLAVGVMFNNHIYAWLFSIAKVARFSHYYVSSLTSALIFNAVMFMSIHVAPIGMGWLIMDEDYEF